MLSLAAAATLLWGGRSPAPVRLLETDQAPVAPPSAELQRTMDRAVLASRSAAALRKQAEGLAKKLAVRYVDRDLEARLGRANKAAAAHTQKTLSSSIIPIPGLTRAPATPAPGKIMGRLGDDVVDIPVHEDGHTTDDGDVHVTGDVRQYMFKPKRIPHSGSKEQMLMLRKKLLSEEYYQELFANIADSQELADARHAYHMENDKAHKLEGAIRKVLHGGNTGPTLQKLGFSKDPNIRADRATTIKERKYLRGDEPRKYRYKWEERQERLRSARIDSQRGLKWQGRWAYTRRGVRYWKADHDPTKVGMRNPRRSPYHGGRWPLRDRRRRDRYRKYHRIPQHYPHKDLSDLGDNLVSGLRDSWNRHGTAFSDKYRPYAQPLNATRTPTFFRPFTSRASRKRGTRQRTGRVTARARSGLPSKGSGDLTGPSWRRSSGYGYRRRPLSPAMRRIERGSLFGPRPNSRFWRDARSPRRSSRGPRGRGGRGRGPRGRGGRGRGPRGRGGRGRSPRSRGGRGRGPRSRGGRDPHERPGLTPGRTALGTRDNLGNPFDSRWVPRKAFEVQFHPKDTPEGHTARDDRFRPLSKFPNFGKGRPSDPEDPTEGPTKAAPVLGQKTPEEKKLLEGSLDGQSDPFGIDAGLSDVEEPDAPLLKDLQDDHFNHKPGGEPLTDAILNSWDMQNGVADP
jgi:hypothetical protein